MNPKDIKTAFEDKMVTIPIDRIITLKQLPSTIQSSRKFQVIASTIEKQGLVEPPVVIRCKDKADQFLLLDGHARLHVLKSLGKTSVICLIATDDEAFTYNKRLCRLATIQEHKMILTLIGHGLSEQRLAELLNVDITTLRTKIRLLDGITPEVADVLKDKKCPVGSIRLLRQLKPARQLLVATLMVSMNTFSTQFVKTMLVTSNEDERFPRRASQKPKLTPDQVEQMQTEMTGLQNRIKDIEGSYGTENLKLVLGAGYVGGLLQNARITRFLSQRHTEIYTQFQRIADHTCQA